MYTVLSVIHLCTAFVMVGAILLQSGKGAEIGAAFGGSSQTIFGGRGATTFLAKFTVGCGVVFMVTSLSLAIVAKERSIGTSIKLPPPAAETSLSFDTETPLSFDTEASATESVDTSVATESTESSSASTETSAFTP